MMNTTFVFGTFLICKTTTKQVVCSEPIERHVCSADEKHDATFSQNFCTICGAKTVARLVPDLEEDVFSAYMISHGVEYADVKLSAKDESWIDNNADKFIPGNETPFGDDYEVFMFDCQELDNENDFVKSNFKFKQPPQKLIERLNKMLEYKEVKVKTGVFARVW